MHRVAISLLFVLLFVDISSGRFIRRGISNRSDRIVSVYDRNCFFSPIGCHFLQGRRAFTFITPTELEQEQRFQ